MNAGQLGDNCKRCGTPLSWICFFVLFCFSFFCCGIVKEYIIWSPKDLFYLSVDLLPSYFALLNLYFLTVHGVLLFLILTKKMK